MNRSGSSDWFWMILSKTLFWKGFVRRYFQVLASMPPDLVARAKDVIYNVCRWRCVGATCPRCRGCSRGAAPGWAPWRGSWPPPSPGCWRPTSVTTTSASWRPWPGWRRSSSWPGGRRGPGRYWGGSSSSSEDLGGVWILWYCDVPRHWDRYHLRRHITAQLHCLGRNRVCPEK